MIRAKDTTWLLLICLLIGQFYVRTHATPIDDSKVEYQDDDYAYSDIDEDPIEDETPPVVDSPAALPYFEENDLRVEAKPGDDVVLNCDARNFMLNNAIMWYKNTTMIVNGNTAVVPRFEAMKNNSIFLQNVTPADSDNYYCVILPQNVRQHTTLRVGARLSILCDDRDITDRSQTFRQGDHHKLECRTYLPGEPTIKWSFNGLRMESSPSDEEKGVIVLDNIDDVNAGVYQCLADDGSHDPPHGMVTIDVQYSPKVSTHRHHVNTEEGGTAEVYCNYRANPIARSFFVKDGTTIQLSEKYSLWDSVHNGHNRTTLVVRNVEGTDLGEYLCHVENAIGFNEVKVHVSYKPETPQFEDMKLEGTKVTMHWLVRSLQPLSEAMLDYKLSGSYTWSTVSVLETHRHNQTGGIWKITHQLDLPRRGLWHARVKTRNPYGWSNFSPDHDFTIQADGEDSYEPSDADLPPDQIVQAGIGLGGRGTASALAQAPVGGVILAALLLRQIRQL
ncbi:protein amalgam [Drosophila bipectinata]|uniref:protein amalgam n=1 Tax=Drosophila bipectinata TaxID=42026 RepID=UPI001C8A1E0B|nr:hemicentin-1 [Drosophila bipectinata]XP_017090772.2 hemicentin-1 [Drosophila bipectinata]